MEPPFLLTYTPPLAPLPIWLSYSSTPILTATATYSYAVAGSPTPLAATIVQTRYSVAVIQLALTVDAPEGIELGFPYVRAGVSTGARIGSVLGGGLITLAPVSTSIPLVTATPTMRTLFPTRRVDLRWRRRAIYSCLAYFRVGDCKLCPLRIAFASSCGVIDCAIDFQWYVAILLVHFCC